MKISLLKFNFQRSSHVQVKKVPNLKSFERKHMFEYHCLVTIHENTFIHEKNDFMT